MNTLSREAVENWERMFCPLEESERELLTDYLARGITRQHQHILELYLQPVECPACQTRVPARQALGRPIEHGTLEEDFTCPHCHRGLLYTVPIMGPTPYYWRLKVPLGPATEAELAR